MEFGSNGTEESGVGVLVSQEEEVDNGRGEFDPPVPVVSGWKGVDVGVASSPTVTR